MDLNVFNDYDICKEICLSPIPVMTGIGHESDEVVADLVCRISHITPTAIAKHFYTSIGVFSGHLQSSFDSIIRQALELLFGEKEGRIAWANRGKDPLYLFAALQRQLGYPVVPKPKRQQPQAESPALMTRRIDRLELRVKLLEEEAKDGIDLSQFDPKNQSSKQHPGE